MITLIKHHNYLNGFLFTFIEFLAAAVVLAPLVTYYVMVGFWLYASIALGIILNCLVVVGIAIPPLAKQEQSIGIVKLYRNKEIRKKIDREYPYLLRETLVLSISTLIPFLVVFLTVYDFVSALTSC